MPGRSAARSRPSSGASSRTTPSSPGANSTRSTPRSNGLSKPPSSLRGGRPSPSRRPIVLHVFAEPLNPPAALAAQPSERPTAETGWLDAVRDGIAEEMRRNTEHHLFRRGHRRTRRHLRSHQEPLSGVRSRPDGRHADFRAWFYRRCARRFGDGGALHRRPDVRRLPVRGGRPDRAAGGEAALHVERPDAGADGDPGRRRRGSLRGAAPLRDIPPRLGPHSRPHRLPALDAGGCQRADEDRPSRPDPVIMLETKALFASKGPVPDGEHLVPFGVARDRATGEGPYDRQRRAARRASPGGGRHPREGRDRGRGDRSADDPAARRRDGRRERAADAPPPRRRRGLCACTASAPSSRRR